MSAATTGKGSEGQGGQGDLQAESTEIPPHGYARTVPAALGQARPTALGEGRVVGASGGGGGVLWCWYRVSGRLKANETR